MSLLDVKNTSGKLYCLYNKVFDYYGQNVYKIGMAKNVENRLNGYTTSYIDKSVILHKSNILKNVSLAEKILFDKLYSFRISDTR